GWVRACLARRGGSSRNGTTAGENGRVRRNANGDLLSSGAAQEFYCSSCFGYIGPTGERVPYESKDVILWVTCPSCMEREAEEAAEQEEQRRQLEERTRPRECELDGCGETFVAATDWQAYCCDQHRWRAHRARRKNGYARR